ncbi:MAG: putative DNA binding domain-containing protein [Propionibacteriaceae bacterium]|jgi:ATP-dependent DNA helicase RecG|nr:putative DNA binding domain-containing protein [Propionibacteriaceae bacterium]
MIETLQDRLPSIVARLRSARTDGHTVEVKSAVGKLPKTTAETLSAFANGSGGILILGLTETQGFTPAKGFQATSIRDALAGTCSDRLQPPLRPAIEIIDFDGGKVVAAEIEPLIPANRPCFVKDRGMYQGSYIRTGDGDRRLSHYEIDRLIEEHRQPRWDEEIVEDASLSDLDQALVAAVVSRQQKLRPHLFGSGTPEAILQGLLAVRADTAGVLRPTLAGLCALGTHPQYYFPRLTVTFSSFPGESKAVVVHANERLLDSRSLVGPIPMLVRDATSAVLRNARIGGRMEGVFRKEVPQYPLAAVREAVTNALMHRDYSHLARGTQVQVNLYTDHLEILSPGGLYGTVTVAQLGSRGISSARNQRLSTLLEEVSHPDGGMVAENRGTGFMMMEAVLKDAGMAPPFADDDISSFSLVFRNTFQPTTRPKHQSTPTRQVIESYLASAKQATSTQIVEATGLARSTVNKHLKAMMETGQIETTHPARSKLQNYRWTGI